MILYITKEQMNYPLSFADKAECHNSVQAFFTTKRWWKQLDANSYAMLLEYLPKYIEAYTNVNKSAKKEVLAAQLIKWL